MRHQRLEARHVAGLEQVAIGGGTPRPLRQRRTPGFPGSAGALRHGDAENAEVAEAAEVQTERGGGAMSTLTTRRTLRYRAGR